MKSKKQEQDNRAQVDFAFPKEWTMYGPVGKADPEPDFAVMTDIPKELSIAGRQLAGQKAVFTDNRLDLGALLGGKAVGKTAYLLAAIQADKAMEIELGAGADWWMKWWVNGEVVCDTLGTGNFVHPPGIMDHRFTARLKAGRNLIAVKVMSGSASFALAGGSSHEMETIQSRGETARRQWRESLAASGKPMALIKEDWETVKTRCTHWWANELYDRTLVMVNAPKQGTGKIDSYPGAVTRETTLIDAEYMIWSLENKIRTTFYGGESTPVLTPQCSFTGPLFMGCEPKFISSGLRKVDPLPAGADGYPLIRFHRENWYWQATREGTIRAAKASRGCWFVNPVSENTGDTLAGIRGVQNLMIDIVENPTWVKQAVNQLSGILIEISGETWTLVDENITGLEGSVASEVWAPGRGQFLGCDMAVNLSPKQFEELFLPSIIEQMRTVDYRCFHMDGYVQHLDLLLALPELQAIQFYPPDIHAPHGSILPWIPLIKRIQRAGKAVLTYARSEEIPALLGEVSARGLCVGTIGDCASEQEARDLVHLVGRLSRER